MSYNSAKANEISSTQGVIEPVAGAATYTTGWIDAGSFCSGKAIITAGTVGTSCDAKLIQATDSSGTGSKDVTIAAITQLVAAGTAEIVFNAQSLDTANDFTHVNLSITTVGATSVVAGIVEGVNARYAPLTADAEVDEIVTV